MEISSNFCCLLRKPQLYQQFVYWKLFSFITWPNIYEQSNLKAVLNQASILQIKLHNVTKLHSRITILRSNTLYINPLCINHIRNSSPREGRHFQEICWRWLISYLAYRKDFLCCKNYLNWPKDQVPRDKIGSLENLIAFARGKRISRKCSADTSDYHLW